MEKHTYLYTFISIFILSSCFTHCISDSITENRQNQLEVNETEEFYAEKLKIKKPEATVNHVKLMNITSKSANFEVNVSVSNPYIVPIPLFELSYNVTSHDTALAWGSMPDPGSLKAKDVTQLLVLVDIPNDVYSRLIKDIIQEWEIDYKIDIRFHIHVPIIGKITIPISKKGVIKLPSLPYDLF